MTAHRSVELRTNSILPLEGAASSIVAGEACTEIGWDRARSERSWLERWIFGGRARVRAAREEE